MSFLPSFMNPPGQGKTKLIGGFDMDAGLLDMVNSYGPLGLASGAIFWLYVRQNARLDILTTAFQDQIREMQDRFDKKESEVRSACDERVARFDQVVDRYNTERDVLLQSLSTGQDKSTVALHELTERVERMSDNVVTGLGEMRQHYARLEGPTSKN